MTHNSKLHSTFVTKDALGSSVLYTHAGIFPPPSEGEGSGGGALPGTPAVYVDYTPYGAPLTLTILASNGVAGVTVLPAHTPNPANGAEYPYATLYLDLALTLPTHLTADVLFDQALSLWNKPTGTRRLFEIVDRPGVAQLVVLAAAGDIGPDDVFHLIRGDDARFGLKDVLAFAPTYDGGTDTTTLTLADVTVAADVVGAWLRPDSASNETLKIIASGISPITGTITVILRGDVTGLVTDINYPIFIYAKQLPLSPIGFAGYYHDGETGLNYAWNRFQSPTTGRWLTRDPLLALNASNSYLFALNMPTMITDPTGLDVTPSQVGTFDQMIVAIDELIKEYLDENKVSCCDADWYEVMSHVSQSIGSIGNAKYRFVFTRDKGFIDLTHFIKAAAETNRLMYTGAMVLRMGEEVERSQSSRGDSSAWGFEDLPSNLAGVKFESDIPDNICELPSAIKGFLNEYAGGEATPPAEEEIRKLNEIANFSYDPILSSNDPRIKTMTVSGEDVSFVPGNLPQFWPDLLDYAAGRARKRGENIDPPSGSD